MRTYAPRFALTLTELLVVLTILAILATVAVTMTEGVVDQARYDATQKTLDNLRKATVSDGNGLQGLSGYVADMGGLPSKIGDLFSNPNGVNNTFQPQLCVDIPGGVKISGGWRGPYLQLPLGAKQEPSDWFIPDSYGNEIIFQLSPTTESPPRIPPRRKLTLTSYSADGIASADDQFVDIYPSDYQREIKIQVRESTDTALVNPTAAPSDINLVIYRIVDGMAQRLIAELNSYYDFDKNDLYVGPMVIFAYEKTGNPAKISTVWTGTITPRSHQPITLILK